MSVRIGSFSFHFITLIGIILIGYHENINISVTDLPNKISVLNCPSGLRQKPFYSQLNNLKKKKSLCNRSNYSLLRYGPKLHLFIYSFFFIQKGYA